MRATFGVREKRFSLHLLQIQHQKNLSNTSLNMLSISLLSSFSLSSLLYFFSLLSFFLSTSFILSLFLFTFLLSFSRYVVVQITLSNESGKKRCDQRVREKERKIKERKKKERNKGKRGRKFRFFP